MTGKNKFLNCRRLHVFFSESTHWL